MPSTMPDLLHILEALVAVPSVSDDAAACARILEVVERQVGDGLHRERIEQEGVQSLVFSTHPTRHAEVVLNAHLDVVPARPEQFVMRHTAERVLGRGVYDMKGAAAVYVNLLRELAAMPPARRPRLQVQFVTDEEVGGARGARILLREGFRGEVFIAGEPTNLDVCHRAKGIVWLTVRIAGQPGHAAMPWQSNNPVHAVVEGLERVRKRWPHPEAEVWATTASVTGLRAGEAHNRIPQEAHVDLDIRRVPDDSAEEIVDFVRDAFAGAEVTIKQQGATLDTAADTPWIARLLDAQEAALGRRPRLYGEHFGSDARFYSEAGVPAFCWGPRGGGMHADDEWLDVPGLFDYNRVLRALIGI